MGFYRYVDYAIKCFIRKIIYSKWFFRILFLISMLVILFNFLSNEVFAAETNTISYTKVESLGASPSGSFVGGLQNANWVTYYVPIVSGFKYTATITHTGTETDIIRYGLISSIPSIGKTYDTFNQVLISAAAPTIIPTFIAQSNGYFYVSIYKKENFSALTFTSDVTESAIISSSTSALQDSLDNQTDEIIINQNNNTDKINDSLTSTNFDDTVINIDTSVTDNIDDSSSTGLFTAVFENLSNLISSSNWNVVEIIDIGLPYTDAKIQLRSDLMSKIVGNSLLSTLINVAWYSLFGLYVFRFSTNIFHAIKSGDILNGLNLNNEVISSTML